MLNFTILQQVQYNDSEMNMLTLSIYIVRSIKIARKISRRVAIQIGERCNQQFINFYISNRTLDCVNLMFASE